MWSELNRNIGSTALRVSYTLMMNKDPLGSFIMSSRPILAQGAVSLCLLDISIPSLVLVSNICLLTWQ